MTGYIQIAVNIVIPRHHHRPLCPRKWKKKTVMSLRSKIDPNYQLNSSPNSFDHNLWRQPSALIKILFSNFFGREFSRDIRQALSTLSIFNKDTYLLSYSHLRSSPYTLICNSEKNITANHHLQISILWSSSKSISLQRFFFPVFCAYTAFFLTDKYGPNM